MLNIAITTVKHVGLDINNARLAFRFLDCGKLGLDLKTMLKSCSQIFKQGSL